MNSRYSPWLGSVSLAASFASSFGNPIDPNPNVVAGQVEFAGLESLNATITQGSQTAIVDYSHFNVPEGGSVQFFQPNSSSAILNRITGPDPSSINGSVLANGQIFFVNPSGVTFGPNSIVRADLFMAAAGQISNEDFLNGIHNFSLDGDVVNHGSIQTENGVGLFGRSVKNTGEIVAKTGYAIVASGDEIHVRQGGTTLAVDVTDAAKASESGVGVQNLGTVDGEEVMFSAGDAFATAIQQSGTVRARKSAKLHADGGRVEVSGTVTARSKSGQGGRIEVGGTDLGADTAPSSSSTLIDDTALLDASSTSGDGGHIVVWSDGHTDFRGIADVGSTAGDGGFIEASGKTIDFTNLLSNIRLTSGGHFLLDPQDILVDATLASSIESLLDGGSGFTLQANSSLPGNGDITFAANIDVPTNNGNRKGALAVVADRDIIINSGVVLRNAQEDFTPADNTFQFLAGRNFINNGLVTANDGAGSTGQGDIEVIATDAITFNDAAIDAAQGSITLRAPAISLLGNTSSLEAGATGVTSSQIFLDASDSVTFNGGRIVPFGETDVFIETGSLQNSTGNNAISLAGAGSFFAIHLPNPANNGSGVAHNYNDIDSGNRAKYNVANINSLLGGITENGYHFANQPIIDITAQNGSKTYGDVFNLLTGGAAVIVDTTDFVTVPSTNPFLPDTTANALTLTGVTTTSPGATGTANAGNFAITPAGATSNNGLGFNYIDGQLTVNPRAITLTASQQNKQYGDVLTLDNTAFTVADLGNASDTTLPNSNEVDTVTLASASGLAASTTEDAGTKSDNLSITGQSGSGGFLASNYDITYATGDLVIDKRNVTVTASQQSKFYGDVLDLGSSTSQSAFTITDNGLTNGGDATLPNGETIDTVSLQSVLPTDVAASTTEPVNTYTDELRITGVVGSDDGSVGAKSFDVNNYNLTFVDGDLVINKRPITLTPRDQSKQYGDVLALGTTAFDVADNGLTDADANASTLPNGEQVDSVPLTSLNGVAADTDDDVATYGNNIGIDGTSFTTANGSNGFNLSNYDVTFGNADLTINKRQVELRASQQEKIYGDTLSLDNTAFTVIDQGNALDSTLPNGETFDTVTISSATGVDASTTAGAQLYSNEIDIAAPVTGSAGSGDGFLASNYDITFTGGDLLVKPRPVTVTPLQQSKTYGDALTLDNTSTAFQVADKGVATDSTLPNGETIETVTIVSRGGHDSSTTSSAQTYTDDLQITGFGTGANGFDADNYVFDFSNLADFVVNRRAVTLTASQQSKDYGDILTLDDEAFTVADKGVTTDSTLPNGETIDTVTLTSANGVAASTDADVATYTDNISITPTSTATPTLTGSNGFDQENYTFSYVNGDLVINQRAITLTASQQSKIYGDTLALDNTAFTTADKDGDSALPNGEVITNVTISSVTGVDASTTADASTYSDEIVIGGPVTGTAGTGDGFNASNYDITYVAGDLVVSKRAITLTATDESKTYGETKTPSTTGFTVRDKDGDATLPNGERIFTVAKSSSVAGDANADAGSYSDDLTLGNILTSSSNFDEGNYTITRVAGDYTINKRAIRLTAGDQSKTYGDVDTLENTKFTIADTFGGGGSSLPNGEKIDTVTFGATTVPGSTTADARTYSNEITITGQSGSAGFKANNYTISYTAGDYTVNKRAVVVTILEDKRFAGALYTIDDTAFTVADKGVAADTTLPNGETIDSLSIFSVNGVAEDPSAPFAVYPAELDANASSAVGSGGFDLGNYSVTVVPGDFEIEPFPGLAAVPAESNNDATIAERFGFNPTNPFAASYAVSQSVGLRLLQLPEWVDLPLSQKRQVLDRLDEVPFHLQTLELVSRIIAEVTDEDDDDDDQ